MMQALFDYTVADLVQVWLAVLLASVVRSVTGFGFALVAIPVFSLFLSPAESVVLCAALTLLSNISSSTIESDDRHCDGLFVLH